MSKSRRCGGPEIDSHAIRWASGIQGRPCTARRRPSRTPLVRNQSANRAPAVIFNVAGLAGSHDLSQHWSGFNSLKRQLNQDLRADMRPSGPDRDRRRGRASPTEAMPRLGRTCGAPAGRRRPAQKRKVENGHTRENSTLIASRVFLLTPLSTIPAMLSSDLSRAG